MEVGKELRVHEVAQVVAGQRRVVVQLAVLALWRGPRFPAVGFVEDVAVFLPVQRGLVGPVLLQPVQIFEEQQPRSLLRVIQLTGATGLLAEDGVDVFEGLLEHNGRGEWRKPMNQSRTLPEIPKKLRAE